MTKGKEIVLKIMEGVLVLGMALLMGRSVLLISDMQKTARMINYAGIVRGATQRLVKLEMAGQADDELMERLDMLLEELRSGGGADQLEALADQTYQESLAEQAAYWTHLKEDIMDTREDGWEATGLLEDSERYFSLADRSVSLAEEYADEVAGRLRCDEMLIVAITALLSLLVIRDSVRSVAQMRKNRLLSQKAYMDDATQTGNRRYLYEEVPKWLKKGMAFSFCYLDLDHLKQINDSYGHEEGDRYIRYFTEELRRMSRSADKLMRLGGDEFVLILFGCPEEDASQKLETVRAQMEQGSPAGYPRSFSYGVRYVAPGEKPSLEEVLRQADERMYAYKTAHRIHR